MYHTFLKQKMLENWGDYLTTIYIHHYARLGIWHASCISSFKVFKKKLAMSRLSTVLVHGLYHPEKRWSKMREIRRHTLFLLKKHCYTMPCVLVWINKKMEYQKYAQTYGGKWPCVKTINISNTKRIDATHV